MIPCLFRPRGCGAGIHPREQPGKPDACLLRKREDTQKHPSVKQRKEITMDPKKEQSYADAIPDDEQEVPAYEQTYRDGSLQNECWAGDGYQHKNREREYEE